MITKIHTSKYALIAIAAIIFAITMSVSYVQANPSFFLRQNNGVSTTATSSIVYMSAGTATTTYYLDAGAAAAGSVDSAVFTEILTGSSTATTLNTSFEYASGGDCIANPNSCEWYSDRVSVGTSTVSNGVLGMNPSFTYQLQFASTTLNGAAGAAIKTTRIFSFPTPTRYVRAVLTMPVGSTAGSIWGEFVAKRQSP